MLGAQRMKGSATWSLPFFVLREVGDQPSSPPLVFFDSHCESG